MPEKRLFFSSLVIKKHRFMSSKSIFAAWLLTLVLCAACSPKLGEQKSVVFAGNPVFPGWYADPEGIVFGEEYWIYPTFSDHYPERRQPSKVTPAQLEMRKNAINDQYAAL